MPDIEPIISSLIWALLLFRAARLTIKLLISLVILVKKLKAVIKSDCSLEMNFELRAPRGRTAHIKLQLAFIPNVHSEVQRRLPLID